MLVKTFASILILIGMGFAQANTIIVSDTAPAPAGDPNTYTGPMAWLDRSNSLLKVCTVQPCSWATLNWPWSSVSKTGSSLADLVTRSATDLTSGTLPDARFPAVLPAVSGANLTNLPAGTGVPAGGIIIIVSGTCSATLGTGWAEESTLNGKFVLGTVAANSDIGGAVGTDNITPAGTNSGAAVANHASHTHTYTQVVNHTHTLATGTGTTGNFAQVIGTVDTSSGGTGGAPTQTALGTLSGNPGGGVASGTTAGPDATLTHSVTQPTFTGTQFDNRPASIKVIFCKKS